jgi:2-keto-4-pentenoate hydratase
MINLDNAIDAFWNSRFDVGAPSGWRGVLSADDGFRIQIAMQNRYDGEGDGRVGWKVAATNPAVQKQLGVSEPGFGGIRASRQYVSGHDLALEALVKPHVECEFCFLINARITKAQSLNEVLGAVDACYPAFEIIEKRVPISDLGAAMADNAEHTAIVLGKPINNFSQLRFDQIECRLTVDETVVGSGLGSAVLDNPLNSILWLKKRLERYGQILMPGTLIMTGSILRQQPITTGEHCKAEFDGVGTVEVRCVP